MRAGPLLGCTLRHTFVCAATVLSFTTISFAARGDLPPPSSPPPTTTSAPSAASAPAAEQKIVSAENAYAGLDYRAARASAESALAQGGLSHDQLLRATRLLALSSAALGDAEASKSAFVKLLAYDPDYRVDPKLGPRVEGPYLEARGYWRAQNGTAGLDVTQSSTTSSQAGPLQLHVALRDPANMVKNVVVGWRWGSTAPYTLARVPAGPASDVEVSPPPPDTRRLEFYGEAKDDRDSVAFESGRASSPRVSFYEPQRKEAASLALSPAPAPAADKGDKGSSIFASPIFWIVTGVVVAGAATAIVVATQSTTTTVVNPPTSASIGASVRCGQTNCQ